MIRVLVCGGRWFGKNRSEDGRYILSGINQREVDWLWCTLDTMHRAYVFTALIHGAAPGADTLAEKWALEMEVPVFGFPADWKKHKRAAGPIRNKRMIDEGKPHMVIAFPGSDGTENMMRQARLAGIAIHEITS